MKISIAVLALINALQARHYLGRRSDEMNLQLEFVDGITDDDLFAPETNNYEGGAVKSLVQAQSESKSDPISGSLGWKKVDVDNLFPAQAFEVKQRNMPKPVLVDDPEQVTDTMDSIKIAEEITGRQLKYEDPEQMQKINFIRNDAHYTYEDSDDETDDVKESKKSVQWAENELKHRWFINAGEKRAFEEKFDNGTIRTEVANFTDQSGEDPQASADELAEKEAAKKAALVKAAEEKREAEIDQMAEAKEAELRAKMTTRQNKKKKKNGKQREKLRKMKKLDRLLPKLQRNKKKLTRKKKKLRKKKMKKVKQRHLSARQR